MVVRLIEPSFEVPSLDTLVLDTENNPQFTSISHGLQATNQITLFELYLRSKLPTPPGPIFIGGIGDGLEFALAPYTFFKLGESDRRMIVGVDKDHKKVARSRRVAELVQKKYHADTGKSITLIVQDPQDLAEQDIKNPMYMDTKNIVVNANKTPMPKFAMVWSSSVMHWLKKPGEKPTAFENYYSILKDNGVLCVCIAAGGTAHDFLQAYFNVFQRLGVYDKLYNPGGFKIDEFEADPIGRIPLDEIARMIERAGFKSVLPVQLAESVRQDDPRRYAKQVEIYGRGEFLKSLPSGTGEKTKRKIWDEIVDEFLGILRHKGWKDGEQWEYTQFNNYVIAEKQKLIPKKREAIYNLYRNLDPEFLRLGYGRDLSASGAPISIVVNGDRNEIGSLGTTVNMQAIFQAVFAYAASDWINEPTPSCSVNYLVQNRDTLILRISLKTKSEKDVRNLFKSETLKTLSEKSVGMGCTRSGIETQYEFKIPLL